MAGEFLQGIFLFSIFVNSILQTEAGVKELFLDGEESVKVISNIPAFSAYGGPTLQLVRYARDYSEMETYWRDEYHFVNATFTKTSLFVKEDKSLGTCGALCTGDSSCTSFRYNAFKRRCIGFKYRFTIQDVDVSSPENGSMYFVKGCYGEGYSYEETIGVCYNFHTERMDMIFAELACEAEDAKLVRIINTDIQDFMFERINYLVQGKNTRVDGTDLDTEGTWKWWNGDLISNPLWQSNNPTGTRSKNCMCLLGENSPAFNNEINKLNDCECLRPRPFICEK